MTPYLGITIAAGLLAAGTQTITVYRTAGGRTMPVRGGIRKYAVGGATVADYEAPFGVPLTYRAEQFDAAGFSLGYTANVAATLDVAETWIHNPLDPATGLAVTMERDAARSLTRPTTADVAYPIGRGVGVAVTGQRTGLRDVDLSFLTFTDEAADAAQALFGDPYTEYSLPPVLCVRTGAGKKMRLPQPLFAAVDVTEVPLDTGTGGSTVKWQVTGQEATPPAVGVIAPAYTLADLDATHATLGALNAAYLTLLDIDRDYGIAGAA